MYQGIRYYQQCLLSIKGSENNLKLLHLSHVLIYYLNLYIFNMHTLHIYLIHVYRGHRQTPYRAKK